MYNTYFGLTENPFNLTPDPRFLFLSQKHKEALSHLRYGIHERKGFIVITGYIGTGKTTILRALLADLDPIIKTALIFNAYVSENEILKVINQEFGISSDKKMSKKECIDALNNFLLETYKNGGNAVLFLDEAQNLSPKVLEQIRMISNLETEKHKLLQIVFVGQSELNELLLMPGLRQLNDRITVRYDLKPLDKKDLKAYVEHRLTVAGARGQVQFNRGAIKALYKETKGNPRLINAISDRALLISYSREKSVLTRNIIKKSALNVKGDAVFYKSGINFFLIKFRFAFIFLLLIMISFAGGWIFNEPVKSIINDFISNNNKNEKIKDYAQLTNNHKNDSLNILEINKPEINKPVINKPEIIKPEINKPEFNKPEINKPEIDKSELAKPKINNHKIINITKPEKNKLTDIGKENNIIKIQNDQNELNHKNIKIESLNNAQQLENINNSNNINLNEKNNKKKIIENEPLNDNVLNKKKEPGNKTNEKNIHEFETNDNSDISSNTYMLKKNPDIIKEDVQLKVSINDISNEISKKNEKTIIKNLKNELKKNIVNTDHNNDTKKIEKQNMNESQNVNDNLEKYNLKDMRTDNDFFVLSMETDIPESLNKDFNERNMKSMKKFLNKPWELGMTAPEIMWIQKTLNDSGYSVKITGIYNTETINAVKKLQKDFGLSVDGIIGPQSKWALFQLSSTGGKVENKIKHLGKASLRDN